MSRLARFLVTAGLLATAAAAQPHPSTGAQLQDLAHPALRFVRDLPSYEPEARPAGVVRLWGHGSHRRNFMGNLIRRWVAEFSRHQPGIAFENRMYGTASAIGALYTGAGEVALLGEEISPAAAAAFTRAKGYAPTEIQVATGSVDVNFFDYAHMIFVHRDNPVAGLSLAQLEAIFGMEGRRGLPRIRTWGDLGLTGEWADRPIQPYGWKVDEDFALFFRERVLEHSHRWNPAIREHVHVLRADGMQYDHGQQIIDGLARDRGGIAISNVRYAVPEVRALPLSWERGGPLVNHARENLISQAYPLVRIIPAYIDRAPDGTVDAAVREFLRYVLSREGQQALIEETGYLPMGREQIEQQLQKLGPPRGAGRRSMTVSPAGGREADHSHSLPPVRTPPATTGVIRIAGNDALAELAAAWGRGFAAVRPGVRIEYRTTGSDVAMAELYTGGADLALLGREATDPEIKAFEWIHRFKPSQVEVATGGTSRPGGSPALGVFVHPDNPLGRLTLDQLDGVLGEERRRGAPAPLRSWGDLGLEGEWAGQAIRLYGPDMESGTGRYFRKVVLGDSRKLAWDRLTEFADTTHWRPPAHDAGRRTLEALSRDRHGLAVAGIDASADRKLKLVALAASANGPFVIPDRATVAAREYPLSRPIRAYFHRTPGQPVDPVLAEFLRLVLGPAGQAAIAPEGGFLPLPETLARGQLIELP